MMPVMRGHQAKRKFADVLDFYSFSHFLVPDGLRIFCASPRSSILVSAEREQSVPLPLAT
jgi:hypothetical protein